MNGEAGKGSRPRPVDRTKWDLNWDLINWNLTEKKDDDREEDDQRTS